MGVFGLAETGVENYILDSYWIEQLLKPTYEWLAFQDSLPREVSPFFHLNPVSFSVAWCRVYPECSEVEKDRLQSEILLNLAGIAELRNRSIAGEDAGLITDKSDRLIFGPDLANSLLEVGYLAHECERTSELMRLDNAWEVLWVAITHRHVGASGEKTYLLVENVEPYLMIDPDFPFHDFSS